MEQQLKTLSGKIVGIDNSQKAFKSLPQKWLRKYRTKDIVEDEEGNIFFIVGVGKSFIHYLDELIIWGYQENNPGLMYNSLSLKRDIWKKVE